MRDSQRGSVTLELVVWVPAMLAFLVLVIVAGRVAQAHQVVEAAAGEAARAATAASDAGSAGAQASAAAANALASAGLDCQGTSTGVDTSAWSVPPGQPARVSATVTCNVALGDVALPGMPGSKTVTGTASSALDTYRVR